MPTKSRGGSSRKADFFSVLADDEDNDSGGARTDLPQNAYEYHLTNGHAKYTKILIIAKNHKYQVRALDVLLRSKVQNEQVMVLWPTRQGTTRTKELGIFDQDSNPEGGGLRTIISRRQRK